MKQADLKVAAKMLAKKGGDKTLAKYGKKHFKAMANKRWARLTKVKKVKKSK